MDRQIEQKIIDGAARLNLTLTFQAAQQLTEYVLLLQKWNKAYNLTAIRELDKMLTHHILDSLVVTQYIAGEKILDVGTGAGLPGIPLAIFYPQKEFVLLDSIGKKIRFLQQVVLQLGLSNVTPCESRVEKFNTAFNFDVIICRAVGNMAEIIRASSHLLQPKGRWLFMKGTYPQQEIDQLRTTNQAHTIDVQRVQVPGVEAVRHVVIVSNKES